MGEVSAGRHALEGADLAPCNQATLTALTDPTKRPPRAREAIPEGLMEHIPRNPFLFDERKLSQNLRSARRGAAPGPSGMTSEHLRPLLDAPGDLHLFFKAAEQFAQASLPEPILEGIRLGRLTALQKPQGGVRGVVVGDIVRRLVAKTMAQQLGPAVQASTSPFNTP